MIKKDRLEKQVVELRTEATSALDSFLATGEREAIHRLRVAIKKFRALTWLLKKCGKPARFKKQLAGLKKTFRDAGRIRSAQMNLSLLHGLGKDGEKLVATEKRKERVAIRAFRKKSPLYRAILSESKDPALHALGRKKIIKTYSKSLKKVDSLLNSGREESLHESRKRIKRLIYNYPLLDKKTKHKLDLDMKFLGSSEETIGKWHDAAIALALVNKISGIPAGSLSKLQREAAQKKKKADTLARIFLHNAIKE